MATPDIMRPYTSMGCATPNVDYIDTDTKVGRDFVLAPGFKNHLEKFYDKATPEDQAKCLELLTSLNIGDAVRKDQLGKEQQFEKQAYNSAYNPPVPPKRPKSAYAALDRTSGTLKMGPYSTTYKREYNGYPIEPANAHRPASTHRAYQAAYELQGPVGETTYHNNYYDKPVPRSQPLRYGTASGDRRNNPHPKETFMKWRLPNHGKSEASGSEWNRELTDDLMDQVCRGQLMSTYQKDYLGIPQGVPVSGLYSQGMEQEDWRSRVPHTLDTFTRKTYQKPDPQPELKGNTLRYGCNRNKNTAAIGAVPTVSSRMPQMHIKTRTTYEREFNDPCPGNQPRQVREMGRVCNGDTLMRHYETSQDQEEKEKLARMMRAMNIQPPSSRPPSSASIRQNNRFRPSGTSPIQSPYVA